MLVYSFSLVLKCLLFLHSSTAVQSTPSHYVTPKLQFFLTVCVILWQNYAPLLFHSCVLWFKNRSPLTKTSPFNSKLETTTDNNFCNNLALFVILIVTRIGRVNFWQAPCQCQIDCWNFDIFALIFLSTNWKSSFGVKWKVPHFGMSTSMTSVIFVD